jgi:integrase/recombinase XerD
MHSKYDNLSHDTQLTNFENYLRYERQLAETTIRNYFCLIGQFKKFLLKDVLSEKDLNKVNHQDISNFLSYLRSKITISSISLYIVALRSYYNWAYYFFKDESLGQLNFFLNNIVKTKRIQMVVPVPTREEVLKLRSILKQFLQLNSWNKNGKQYKDTLRACVIIELLITAGLRLKELEGLRRQDINLEDKILFVKSGKGGHQRMSLFGENVVEILKEYFEVNKLLPDEMIFSMVRYNVIYRTVKLWAAKAKINPNIRPHSFRHYFITESLNQGIGLQDAADQAGQIDLNTTRHYTHRNIEHLREAYKKVVI